PESASTITPTISVRSSSTPTATISRRYATCRGHDRSTRTERILNGPRPFPPQRIRLQLLARLCRCAVDAGAVDRVPALGVPGGAVLPVASDHRQGQGAGGIERQDRAAQRPAVAG